MMYSNDDETETNLLENLEALCRETSRFTVDPRSLLGEDEDHWMLLDPQARIHLEVDCWGRRLA